MALYDEYFTNEDKPFAENLNDALLLSNVFDMTVDIEAPKMFSNSTWVNSISPRKCGVSILTLKDGLPTGVSVGTDSITGNSTLTGTGTVKLSWYPNFNSFGKFKAITWENTGTIVVNLKTSNGTTIASNISKGTINNQSSELRTLQEIVIEIVFTNATLKSLIVTMENKQTERYGATVGITDVTDLDTRLNTIATKDNQQDTRLGIIETIGSSYRQYEIRGSSNVEIGGFANIIVTVKNQNGTGVAGETVNLLLDGVSAGTETTDSYGTASWNVKMNDWGLHTFSVKDKTFQVLVDGWKQIGGQSSDTWGLYRNKYFAKLVLNGWTASVTTSWKDFGSYADGVRPMNAFGFTSYEDAVLLYVNNSGEIKFKSNTGATQSAKQIYAQVEWSICDEDI